MPESLSFYELRVWKNAHRLAVEIWVLTSGFPRAEVFGMTSQLRRAASSVGANIAEGYGRYHYPDRIKFLYQARGSLFEVQNFLLLARDLQYIQESEIGSIFEEYIGLAKGLNFYIHQLQGKRTS
jgi:four helix bundle protein